MCLNVETDPFLGGACVARSMWCPIPLVPMWTSFSVECGGYLIKKGPIELHLSGSLELLIGAPWVKDWECGGGGCKNPGSCFNKFDDPELTFDLIATVTGNFKHTKIGVEAEITLTAVYEAAQQLAKMSVSLEITAGDRIMACGTTSPWNPTAVSPPCGALTSTERWRPR
jgi:hypothetical protein